MMNKSQIKRLIKKFDESVKKHEYKVEQFKKVKCIINSLNADHVYPF